MFFGRGNCTSIIEVNRVVVLPRMVCNVWALCIVLQIPLVFLPSFGVLSFKLLSWTPLFLEEMVLLSLTFIGSQRLLSRESSLPSSHEGKTREINHVRAALEANGYPSAVISTILNKKPPSPTVPKPEELVSMFFKWAEPTDTYKGFACLPYISGLTEPLTRLLRNNEIRVVNKPLSNDPHKR